MRRARQQAVPFLCVFFAPESSNVSETSVAPAKSKKLIVILAVLALLVVAGAAAWGLLASRDMDEEGGRSSKAANRTPPTFLAIENMVVNLADPGGDRFAQVGITLELKDAKTAEMVKAYMPSIRSSVLMLLSQRTTDELLTREGKEKLAADVRREVARPLGYTVPKSRKRGEADPDEEDDDEDSPRPRASDNPVRQVLFSSFIIQ